MPSGAFPGCFPGEYYFEPIGLFSASVFLKEVDGFIYSSSNLFVPAGPNNGFDGLYEGCRVSTSLNGGKARYRGSVQVNWVDSYLLTEGPKV